MPTERRATYRVQLHAGFDFARAADVAGYLAALGASHLYSSPYLQAAPGSTHGYDVVDHRRVNAELGGAEGHARLCRALGEAGLGQVLDVVPNHMAIGGRANPWWWDVLENGPSSRYADYFDVDWDPPETRLRNVVLLPVLGDHYGRVLEAGELRLAREDGRFIVRYHDHAFPVSPRSLDDLAFLADALGWRPHSTAVARRHRDKEVLARQLERLIAETPAVGPALDAVVAGINADPDALDDLLQRQNYRLALWRTAGRELGYRRFFDIDTLVGLRIEDERVFQETHALVLGWLRGGVLDGLRIDHPDGLRDPQTYFRRLRDAAPEAWLLAEKILEPGERLPESWPIDGTTGYDFIHRVSNLLVDPAGEVPLTKLYGELTGESTDYALLVREKKQQVLRDVLGSDVNRLTALFLEVCERHRRHRDYTRHELHEALREVIAGFPVYRTYVRAEAGEVSEADARYVSQAIEAAKASRPDLDPVLMEKATREAKAHTSWLAPTAAYDAAVRHFVESALGDREFAADLEAFVAPLIEPGRIVSLSQTLLKLTAPGVPDLYQGTELWDLSLVDPDNRRPVDYAVRRRLLAELDALTPERIWARIDEGLPKLWVIRQALALRRRRPRLFGPAGAYAPLRVRGAKAGHAVAFGRGGGAVTVVPRLVLGLGGDWDGTVLELPVGGWRNELTGEMVEGGARDLGELLGRFPVALLSRDEGGES